MNNAVFGKTMEIIRKYRDIKLVTTKPSYKKFFLENLLEIQLKEIDAFRSKPLCLDLAILEINKIVIYDFWYDYVKLKHGEKSKLCYVDTDSFMVQLFTRP